MENKYTKFFHKNTVLVLSGIILMLGIVLFGQFFSMEKLFVFTDFADDSYTSYLPSWFVDERLSHEGLLSTYSFYHAAGNSYVQNVPLDPVGFVLFWITRLAMSLWGVEGVGAVYFYSKFLISFLGTGIFTYLWIRELNVGKYVSMLAGLFAAFSGGIVVMSLWNIEMYGFYLAFYLFSVEQLLQKRRPYFVAIAAAMLASQPYQLYLYSLFVGIYLVFRVIVLQLTLRRVIGVGAWIFGMGLLGLLINMPSLLNSLTVQLNTPRMTGANDINSFASSFFVDGDMLASLVLRLFGHNIAGNEFFVSEWNNYLEAPALYCGILSLLVFPQIFQYIGQKKRIAYSAFIAVWFMVLIINPLRQFVLLGTGDYFRYGINFFFIFAMLMVMAQSLNVIVVRRTLNFPLLLVSAVACCLLLWYFAGREVEYTGVVENFWIVYFAFAMIALDVVLLLMVTNAKNRQLAKISIYCVALFEVFVLVNSSFDGRSCVNTSDLEFNKANYDDGIGKSLQNIRNQDSTLFYRIVTDYSPGKTRNTSINYNQVLGYYSTIGYNSFNQPEYVRYLESTGMACPDVEGDSRWLNGVNFDLFSLSFMGVRYYISNNLDTLRYPPSVMYNSKHWQVGNQLVFRFNNAMPLGFALDKYLTRSEFVSLLHFKVFPEHLDHIVHRLQGAGLEPRADVEEGIRQLVDKSFQSYDDVKEFLYSRMPAEYAHWVAAGVYFASHESLAQEYTLLQAFAVEDTAGIDLQRYSHIDFESVKQPDYMRTVSNNAFDSIAKANLSESLDITSFVNNHIKGRINVSKPKMLVLTIPYDKAWVCKVDGAQGQLHKIDVGFSGVEIGEGEHEIELIYEPLHRNLAIWISIIAALLMYVFVIYNIISSWQALRKA